VKSPEKDGYKAVQMCSGTLSEKKAKKLRKPQKGFYIAKNLDPREELIESRVDDTQEYEVGKIFSVEYFKDVDYVDVIGITKGKGFQGVMKLHGFRGGPAAHGSGFHRTAGSTGMRSTPGRSLPGSPRASRMGGRRQTVQNLQVVRVDEERNLLLVKGAVPGCAGSVVYISKAIKLGE
ncbi:MAG: 50S ribosomal protein L3, partial [Chlamydiota bacterium]